MKRFIKYIAWALAIVLALTGGVIAYVFITTGGKGTSYIEEWIGAQIKSVAQENLNVRLEFEKPDYQYPKTVVLENIRLTADDPANPGKSIDIMTIARAKMTLAEIPKSGEPLHIEQVILDDPVLRFIATGQGAAAFVGFSNLIKKGKEPEEAVDPNKPPPKVTDVFRIRMIQLNRGRIVYDPRQADKRAMDLDQINCQLDVQPDDEGWYKLTTKFGRESVFSLDMDGLLNINDNILKLASLQLRVTLGDVANRSLPPQLQTFLAEHDVKGNLLISGDGTLNLSNMIESEVSARVELDGGNLSVGDYLLNVSTLNLEASLANRQVQVSRFDLRTLGGTIEAKGQLALNDTLDTSLSIQGQDLRIERILKVSKAEPTGVSMRPQLKAEEPPAGSPPIRPEFGEAPPQRAAVRPDTSSTSTAPSANAEAIPFAGKLEFKLDLRAPLNQFKTQLYGSGRIFLTEGHISSLPVISDLENALAVASNLVVGRRPGSRSETALFLFDLKGNHGELKKIDYRSTLIAARGVGTVHFADGKLNLKLHGGPIEKIQSLLGPVGDITAIVTDQLMGYNVTGTTAEPKVEAVVAGGILNDIGNFFKGK